jgi:hypothetical protein
MATAKIQVKRKYKLTLAGQLVKHLGLQMYSGAVSAIAELVSNAYDAMARNVWITIPLDVPLNDATNQIIVEDDGHGMTYEECNGLYLYVGYERRAKGEWTQPYNGLKARKVQGRKGIGKLSGFGIANRIEVRTIKNKEISHFAMYYDAITRGQNFVSAGGYEPEVLNDDGQPTKDRPQTKVVLSQLKITRAIPRDQFIAGLARRILVLDSNFKVYVNGDTITRNEIPLQFRFPSNKNGWETGTLENGQQIQWWAGFCKEPIKDDMQRGFVVYVRGKLAQEPWFFDLSGGTFGQHGMQYMTGEIRADFLDETIDLIATDRASVRWEDPLAFPLKVWGQKQVKVLLDTWVQKRIEKRHTNPVIKKYLSLASKLPIREREVFNKVVDRICSIPQIDKDKEGREIVDDLVEFVYNALTNRSFLEAIRQLNAASTTDLQQFNEVLSEWDIIEAVNTAHLVKGHVEIIRKFAQMIKNRVPEKPDMQEYLKDHPWLIDPKWTMLHHEKSLDNVLADQFNLSKSKSRDGQQRLDFFCLGDGSNVAHVVEVKRPGDNVGKDELDKLNKYVYFLKNKLIEGPIDQEKKRMVVSGLLVCEDIRAQDRIYTQDLQKAGMLRVWRFEDLLDTTLKMHRDYLQVVKERASLSDPRIQELDEVGTVLSVPHKRGYSTKARRTRKASLRKKSKHEDRKRSS